MDPPDADPPKPEDKILIPSVPFSVGVQLLKPKKPRTNKTKIADNIPNRSSSKMIAAAILDGLPAPTPVTTPGANSAIPAAGGPTAFLFEMPKFGNEDSASTENTTPTRFVPLVLPPKAWESLSLHLSLRELARCASACKVWKATISQSVNIVTVSSADGARVKQLKALVPNVEKLYFTDAHSVIQLAGEGELRTMTKVTEFRVIPKATLTSGGKNIATSDAMLEFSLVAPHLPPFLTHLEVPCSRYTRGALTTLQKLHALTHLDLSKGDWRADDWQWAPLSDDPVRDDWIDHFPTGLIELNLSYCHVLSDRILKKLKRFPRLTVLDVEGCFQITDVGLASIGPNVLVLNMAQCIGVFRKGEARQGVLPAKLDSLRLSFNFNDHFINYIPHTLKSLFLEKSYVTDGGMKYILACLKGLTQLSVAACINVGDATLAVLPPALTYLDLWHNRNVTDTGLKSLKRCSLITLDITSCSKLTCQGIVDVAAPPLRTLAVGALFLPDHLIVGVALIRNAFGVSRNRPRLFSDTVKV